MKIKGIIGRTVLVLVLLLMMAILVNGQDEEVIPEEAKIEESEPQKQVEPVEIVTRLRITLIDDIGGHKFILENAVVQIVGELHIAGDSITYSDVFAVGDMYEMIIWIKRK